MTMTCLNIQRQRRKSFLFLCIVLIIYFLYTSLCKISGQPNCSGQTAIFSQSPTASQQNIKLTTQQDAGISKHSPNVCFVAA